LQYAASLAASVHLVRALRPPRPSFDRNTHIDVVKVATAAHRLKVKSAHDNTLGALLGEGEDALPNPLAKRVATVHGTGHWLTASPSTPQGDLLTNDEFRVGICVRFGLRPPFLQDMCDGCGAATDLHHALTCTVGGLVIARHGLVLDVLMELAELAFGESRVGYEPTIFPPGYKHPEANGQRGDLNIKHLWARNINCIIDVIIPHAEGPSNMKKTPQAVVLSAQLKKKREYGALCKANRKHFTPFAVTTSGLLAPEAKALLKCFARALADKWEQPLSVTSNYVYTKVSFAVVRATHDNIFSARTRSGHGKCPVFGTDPTTPPIPGN
jgi:hypothetical protein